MKNSILICLILMISISASAREYNWDDTYGCSLNKIQGRCDKEHHPVSGSVKKYYENKIAPYWHYRLPSRRLFVCGKRCQHVDVLLSNSFGFESCSG